MSSLSVSSSETVTSPETAGMNNPQTTAVDQQASPQKSAGILSTFRKAEDLSGVDERCIFYCKQTQERRMQGHMPLCSSYCFRRVYGHEVGAGDHNTTDVYDQWRSSARIPLPPEGQPEEAVDKDGHILLNDKTKYWRQGTYLYKSSGPGGLAQGKLMGMSFPLAYNAMWTSNKEAAFRALEEAEASGRDPDRAFREALYSNPFSSALPIIHPITEIRHSVLLRLMPISTYLQESLFPQYSRFLQPSYNVLAVVRRSFEEGGQRRLFEKAYEHATDGSALDLLRLAWSRRDLLWKKVDQVEEDDDRKKKGKDEEI